MDQPVDPNAAPFNVDLTVDSSTHYQTMVGFGAAVAFEIGFLANQPNRTEIYNALFVDAGLQVLRVAGIHKQP